MFNFHRDSPSAVWHTASQPIRGTCLWCRTCDLHFGWRLRKDFSLRKDVLSQTKQTKSVAHCSSCNWVKRAAPSYAAGNWCRSVTWRVAKGIKESERGAGPRSKRTCFFFPPLVYLNFPSAGLPGGSKTERRNVWFLLKCQPGEAPPPSFFLQFSAPLKQPLASNWTRQRRLSFQIASEEEFSWKTEVMTFFLQTREGRRKKNPPAPAASTSPQDPPISPQQPPDNCLTSCQTLLCCLPHWRFSHRRVKSADLRCGVHYLHNVNHTGKPLHLGFWVASPVEGDVGQTARHN